MSSSDRFPYETATVLDQTLLDNAADNLTNNLEMVCDIETPSGFIRASDRNKFVGGTFYEALIQFPEISRTVGEWLSGQLEFSTIDIELSNVDGRFNDILPSGSNFGGWINKTVEIRLGLRDVASTYTTVFSGFVTEVQGVGRTVTAIKITARDRFDNLSVQFPTGTFRVADYPNIQGAIVGQTKPVIYGDWTVEVNQIGASIPTFVVNGEDVNVIGGSRNNVELVISDNDNTLFDQTEVYLLRASEFYQMASADIVNVAGGLNAFEVDQNTGNTLINGANYLYEQDDTFFVKVKGKDLGVYDDNIVEIGRDILTTYTTAVLGDFDSNWDTFRDKAAPAESAISTFKARAYIDTPTEAMGFVLELLEQVRLEAFIDRDLNIKLNSLHFDDWVPDPSFDLKNWDVARDSLTPTIDTRNNFNRAFGRYAYLPNKGENNKTTPTFRNAAAVTQAGKEITRRLFFPNLYEAATVELQVQEMLKLASAYLEVIDVTLTWRSLLLDIGDFVKLKVQIQSTVFDDVPCMIRDIGYNPIGFSVAVRLFSFQMVPFGTWNPGYTGIVGGQTATITQE